MARQNTRFFLITILFFSSTYFMVSCILPPPPNLDFDDDGVPNLQDNCLNVPNADQLNVDDDAYGAACECDDDDPDIYPGAPELCDGKENQCPGDLCYGDVDDHCGTQTAGMATIPCSCFDMGDAFSEGDGNELPVHEVCLSAFEIDIHEITNAEYRQCVINGPCTRPDQTVSTTRPWYYGNPAYSDYPVIFVSWEQVDQYCAWAGKRLPTEAEWEYAARGGLAGKRYPLGDTISPADANYIDSGDPYDNDTSPVEDYQPNGYGLYDMAGNVWEWVDDWYGANYYSVSPLDNPPGPDAGTFRVLRGGSWHFQPFSLRGAVRWHYDPTNRDNDIGGRCAK